MKTAATLLLAALGIVWTLRRLTIIAEQLDGALVVIGESDDDEGDEETVLVRVWS